MQAVEKQKSSRGVEKAQHLRVAMIANSSTRRASGDGSEGGTRRVMAAHDSECWATGLIHEVRVSKHGHKLGGRPILRDAARRASKTRV